MQQDCSGLCEPRIERNLFSLSTSNKGRIIAEQHITCSNSLAEDSSPGPRSLQYLGSHPALKAPVLHHRGIAYTAACHRATDVDTIDIPHPAVPSTRPPGRRQRPVDPLA
ncbi:hypothetical protein VFPFJ_00865 [Purpureocillium lilacinum]|uniref:Uncharacterized protein n=1 Tax=Purpureocillium lilacinum TaxID=33203 RepID=A0A179HB19_PURLI|nr:hypothetical protein VFPFJ_00865 [Purpureocillium lilacinum]OAQ86790.1 hypothetical protein VFPBJ_00830 [Purpureocillium lilacinum]OAQ94756.1 hypothetical protein VFPFJ_00865 [Purpureocillium lilacinum]